MIKENPQIPWKMTSFQHLSFTIGDVLETLKLGNMNGIGVASIVYRDEMLGSQVIAVKKPWRVEKESVKPKKWVLVEV